jgi:hypothetical protein
MTAARVARPARWGHLAVEDEHVLLELAELPGDVGDVALDALTHLPLRVEAWERVRSLLRKELAVTGEGGRRRFLWRVLRWVPVFEPGDALGDNGESETQDRFIRLVRRVPDLAWIWAPAPGFLLVDADVREAALAALVPRLGALAHELEARGPFSLSDQELASGELDPLAVTALFESAASADYYRIQVGNALVAHIARNRDFRPDLLGLFLLYRRTLTRYAERAGRSVGAWLLDGRDDESPLPWLSWQLAWTASRGGIVELVAGLRRRLSSADLEEKITACSFVADAADYCVQPEPEFFGGGRLALRLGQDDSLRVFADPPPRALRRRPRTRPVMIGSSAPRKVPRGTPFVARLVAYAPSNEATAEKILKSSRSRPVSVHKEIRRSSWAVGAEVAVTLHGEGLEVQRPRQSLVWDGKLLDFVFDAMIDRSSSLDSTVLRFDVVVAGVPVAHPRIEVMVDPRRASLTRVCRNDRPVSTAFASYSHMDREKALFAVVTYQTAGIDVFIDVLGLRAGDNWEERLSSEIDARELFVLMWSHNAKESIWVGREVDLGLRLKGSDAFVILPLEPHVPPPDKLRHLHFNDPATLVGSVRPPS